MPERDPQSVVLSRQSILLVTAVSVGLLTLCYVLGVQVGKQSAALRQSSSRGSGEDLQELPAPLQDQLKTLETSEPVKGEKTATKPEESKAAGPGLPGSGLPGSGPPGSGPVPGLPKPEASKKPEATKAETPKPEAPKADESKWTVQLVSTPDSAEAERIAGRAKAAGYATTTVKDKGLFKVRLTRPGSRPDIEALEGKLKAKGFKTYPVKVS